MATWGEFMREFKIVNQKGKVLVEADEVLDVWEERNKLRTEVEELRQQVAQERERCAADVEEFAQACGAEPDQPAYVVSVLETAAALIRQRAQAATAEEAAEPATEAADEAAPPMAEIVSGDEAGVAGEIPLGEPVEEELLPTAEYLPTPDALPEERQHS